jgi:glycosyltransferase involved in cell wall biosynthesis
MPDPENSPRSPLVAKLSAVRKGRSPKRLLGDAARVVHRGGVRGAAYRTTYEMARMLAPPAPPPPPPGLNDRTATVPFGVAAAPHFNPDALTLAANREVVDGFASRERTVRSATWFVPYFEHVLFGGISTVFRFMNYLTVHHEVEHRIVLFDNTTSSDAALRAQISSEFPALGGVDIVMPEEGRAPFSDFDELPFTDIAVCTIWHSAYALARFNATHAKYYFVQDYEPLFYPAGTMYALAEATYRFGFAGLVNTPGLESIYASYGNPSSSFVPAVQLVSDRDDKPSSQPGAPVQIVLYGRPQTDRNGFELLANASRLLKDRFGESVRIVSAGEEFDPGEFRLHDVVENMGLLRSRAEIHQLYADSDIGVCCMFSKHPSYQPFEYMAAGAAVVTNTNAATSWFLRDGENCLVSEPFPVAIADAIGRLVTDAELRLKLVDRGRADVTSVEWETEFGKLWRFMSGDPDVPGRLPT